MDQIGTRLNNWRGTRVLKLIFYIKAKRKEIRQPQDEIYYLLESSTDKALSYGTFAALQKTLMFVNKVFDVKSISREVFTKKTFGVNRILSVLEFLDFELRVIKKQLRTLEKNINDRETYFENNFCSYFQAQEKVYLEIADLIVSGRFDEHELLIGDYDDLIED